MEDSQSPRHRFALADLLLLFVGLGVGFWCVTLAQANELRTQEYPEYAGREPTTPVGWLYVGVSLGTAVAFPLLRVREWIRIPDERRLRLSDIFGYWPALAILLITVAEITQGLPRIIPGAFVILTLFSLACLMFFAIMGVFMLIFYLNERDGTWLDLLGCATATLNGGVLVMAMSNL